ncbi:hypothetical protein [Pedobacter xixiisoli]|uniref:Cupin domain-containing protein n=1 Tax=Pedobacter xixiisoli TaxID=1476464 RepID=A0A285ZSX6_9SPHI|nr:hypothetical protein [Pedobacter xixiisoli]SOD12738.1 hypothetical protein SAMN06297358_0822 [Pedobacter xixiisoli]
MEIKKISYAAENEHYNKELFLIQEEGLSMTFGTVFLMKGTRIPEKGFSKHEQHEISVIQQGKIEMLNENGTIKGYLTAGDVVFITALEAQAGNVLEETQIIYTLFGKKGKNK